MAESEEELKSLLMKVKEESEKVRNVNVINNMVILEALCVMAIVTLFFISFIYFFWSL